MNFEIDTKYTFEEYKRFNKVVQDVIYKGKSKRNFAIVIFALIIGGFVVLKEYITALVALAVYVAIMYLTIKGINKQVKDAFETNASMKDAVYHYKFSDTKVEATSPRGLEVLEYDKMYRLIETDTNFYMMIAQNVGFIINKDNCTADQQEFIRSLSNELKK